MIYTHVMKKPGIGVRSPLHRHIEGWPSNSERPLSDELASDR